MPDCEENVKVVYSHATMTEAMMATTANKDREVVIVPDFDADSVESLKDCSGNNYILAHEYCDPESGLKIRRNFVSYEALRSEGLKEDLNYICSGSDLINIDSHHNYFIITGEDGWSVQSAIEELDQALINTVGDPLKYIKDGPTDGSLKGSDGSVDSVINGSGKHQFNLGKDSFTDASYSTLFGGEINNIIGATTASFMGTGNYVRQLNASDYSFSGTGESNLIDAAKYASIMNGKNNTVRDQVSKYSTILNGDNNTVNEKFATVLNGNSAFVENKGEVVIAADIEANNSFGHTSKVLSNAITTDSSTPAKIKNDNVNGNSLIIPKSSKPGDIRDGGALTGNVKVSGLYVHGTVGNVKTSTVEAIYLFSAVTDGSGYDVDFIDLNKKTSESIGSGASPVDISTFDMVEESGMLVPKVISSVDGEVLWSASFDFHRQVKDEYEAVITTTPEVTTTTPEVTTTTSPDAIPSACIVAWYKWNDNKLDSTSNNNHWTGDISHVTGVVANGGILQSQSTVPHNSSLNMTEITMESWINVQSTTGNLGLFNKQLNSFALFLTGNNKDLYFRTGTTQNITNLSFSNFQWVHIAATFDGTTRKVYLNGVLQSSVAGNPIQNNTIDMLMGKSNPHYLDETTLYNCALTQQQIQAIVDSGSAGKTPILDNPLP